LSSAYDKQLILRLWKASISLDGQAA
jgi:hypothetical protein